MSDRIRLHGLRGRGRHGVFGFEREQGQEFVVDLALDVDTRAAASTDDLADTVDYGSLAAAVVDLVEGEPVNLVETLAARIAQRCLADRRVAAVEVTVHKPEAPVTVPFDDVTVTITRSRDVTEQNPTPEASESIVDTITEGLRPIRRAALGLGSNLGDSLEHLQGAVDALLESPAITAYGVSPVYEAEPVGGPEGQPRYLNAVLVVDTTLGPTALLERAQAVEEAFGRVRDEDVRWGPRTLDIDVLAVGDRVVVEDRLVVPHPRAHERSFVLAPWADVDPAFDVPGHGRVSALLEGVGRDGVSRRSDIALDLP